MRRIGRIILMAAGLVMMCVILVISGFVETGVCLLGILGCGRSVQEQSITEPGRRIPDLPCAGCF